MKKTSTDLVLKIKDFQLTFVQSKISAQEYTSLCCSHDPHSQESLDLASETTKFLGADHQRLLMIIGSAGSGKTLFTLRFIARLWESYVEGDPIPLWCNVSQYPDTEAAVWDTLKQSLASGLDENSISAEIDLLRKTKKFIIVFDAFDETFRSACPWVLYDLEHWNAKAIFTCRQEYLYWWEDFSESIIVYENEEPHYRATKLVYLKPLSQEQVNDLINSYVNTHPTGWSFDQYIHVLNKMTSIKELTVRPYFLDILLDILPSLICKDFFDQNHPNLLSQELILSETIIDKWFERQESKLQINRFVVCESDIKNKFMNHEMDLAGLMKKTKKYEFFYDPENGSMESYGELNIPDPIMRLFGHRDSLIQRLQSASLIIQTRHKCYSFMSSCLYDYFVSKYFEYREYNDADDISQEDDLQSSLEHDELFQHDFVNDSRMIQNFADIACDNQHFENRLIGLLLESKENPAYAKGAANAITILVKKGMRFNDVDLSNVKIPNADISGGFFDRANFMGADLSNVIMNNTWLRGADFEQCLMRGVSFREYPWYTHPAPIESLDYLDELHRLVVASGKDVVVWNTNTGTQDFVLKGHQNIVTSVRLSNEGDFIVSASYDHTVRFWNLKNEMQMGIVGAHQKYVNCVDLSFDNRWIASGSEDGMIGIWDVLNMREHRKFNSNGSNVKCVRFAPNAKYLISTDTDNNIYIWTLETGSSILFPMQAENTNSIVNCLSFSRNGKLLAMGTNDNLIYIWDFESRLLMKTLRGHDNEINGVQFNFNATQLISGSKDKTVMVWELETEDLLAVLRGADREVKSACYINDCKCVIAGGYDQKARIWEIPTDKSFIRSEGHNASITCVQITSGIGRYLSSDARDSCDGRFVSTSEDGVVQIHDINEGNIKSTFTIKSSFVKACVSTSDEKFIILGLQSGIILIRELRKPENTAILSSHKSEINFLKLSSNDSLLISCADEDNVKIWDVKSRKVVSALVHDDRVQAVDFNSTADRVVTGCNDKIVRVWDRNRGAALARLIGHSKTIQCVRFSPNDDQIVSCGRDGKILLWDIEQKQSVSNFQELPTPVTSVEFCFNGRKIISASEDNSIRLWNISTNDCVVVLSLRGGLSCMAFHNDRKLLTGYADGAIDCWDYFEDAGYWLLSWSTDKDSRVLNVNGLIYSQAKELSIQNEKILEQHGARASSYSPH